MVVVVVVEESGALGGGLEEGVCALEAEESGICKASCGVVSALVVVEMGNGEEALGKVMGTLVVVERKGRRNLLKFHMGNLETLWSMQE